MESKEEKIEQIKLAIQKLILKQQNKQLLTDTIDEDNEDDRALLSRLLSQLDALKGDGMLDQADPISQEATTPAFDNVEPKEEGVVEVDSRNKTEPEEIVKEIRKVKRQNLITHCLLSAMIILTVTWQLSEVSLLLQLKDGVRHPFRSIGGMLKGMIKKPVKKGLDAVDQKSSAYSDNENNSFSNFKISELSQVEIPEINLNGDQQ